MKRVALVAGIAMLVALAFVLARGRGRDGHAAVATASMVRDRDAAAEMSAARTGDARTKDTPAFAGDAAQDVPSSELVSAPSQLPEEDPVGCVIYGRVTDASGAPVKANEVYVRFEDAAGVHIPAAVNASGAYSATGLKPGHWLMSCGVRGYRPARVPLDLGEEQVVRRDIALEPAVVLRVKLTAPDGRPFLSALRSNGGSSFFQGSLVPVATNEDPGPIFEGVEGSLNNPFGVGQFWQNGYVFEALPQEYYGVVVLKGDLPVYVSLILQSAVLATQRVQPGQQEVAFELAPEALQAAQSSLRCRVVDAGTEVPIEGAELELWGGSYQSGRSPRTDAKGEVVIAQHEPGTFDLWLRAEGRADIRREVTLPPGETLDLGTLELVPETWISGRLVDAEGQHVEGLWLELGVVDPEGRLIMIKYQSWMSDEHGAFRFGALAPGRYVVRSAAREGRPSHPEWTRATANHLVSTLAGPVEGLELPLLPIGRLVLRYDRPDWEALRYEVLDEGGFPRARDRAWQPYQNFTPLPHGKYRVVVRDGAGAPVLEREIEVGKESVVLDVPTD